MSKPVLPSEKAALATAEKAALEVANRERESHLRTIMNGCFHTPDGIQVLKWLAGQCQFGRPIQIIDERSMMLGVMRHNLYTEIRKHLTYEILKEVEHV